MHNVKLAKFISFMLAIMFAVGIFEPLGISVPAVTAYAADDDVERKDGAKNVSEDVDFWGGVDVSFAQQIRMATNYMNRQAYSNLAPGESAVSGGQSYYGQIDMSNVGVFFGYTSGEINTDKVQSPEFVITEKLSATAVSYSRDQINSVFKITDASNNLGAYADYGLMLNMMGFDNVGSDAPEAQRGVFGFIALIAYYGASSVNALFEAMFKVLDATNPFQFFKDVDFGTGKAVVTDAAAKADAAIDGGTGAMNTLRKFISDIYTMFTEFAWAIAIPLALIFIIVAFFLTRRGRMSFGSNIKKFLIRAVFIVIGIPIMGSAYTQVLTQLKDSQALSDDFITQAVSYTFLDFGAWVEASRLDPSGVEGSGTVNNKLTILGTGDIGTQHSENGNVPTISANTWLHLREMCSNLNYKNKVFENAGTEFLSVSKDTGALLKDYIYETTGAHLSVDSGGGNTAEKKISQDNKHAVMSLITKYMTGERYTASMYKNAVTSKLNELNKNKDKSVGNLFALSANKYSFSIDSDRPVEGLRGEVNPYYSEKDPDQFAWGKDVASKRFDGGFSSGFTGGNLWNNGTIKSNSVSGSGNTDGNASYGTSFIGGGSASNAQDGIDPTKDTGFSTMSMFSYLTTKFSQKGFVCYGGAPSVYTQNGHFAVNLVGGDQIMQMSFFANMIAILGGYFLLAVFFVFRTAFEIIFKGFQLIGHALFAALGFYKSIGTVICMTVNMIAELFVSVIFFSFMVDIMFIITSVFDHVLSGIFDTMGLELTGEGMSNGIKEAFLARTVVIASSFFATLVIIFFVSFAIRWRAAIMASLNSMIENIIGTLLGVQLGGASEGYMPGMAKAALNDTVNIARAGAAGAGAIALADGARDMVNDISSSAIETFGGDDENEADAGIPTGDTTAADAAANPSPGAGFDGGKGKTEGDAEVSASEVNGVLANGLEYRSKDDYFKEQDEARAAANGENDSSAGGGTGTPNKVYRNKDDYFKEQEEAREAANEENDSSAGGGAGAPDRVYRDKEDYLNGRNNDSAILPRADKAGAGNSNDSAEPEAENSDDGLYVGLTPGSGGGHHRGDNNNSSSETRTESAENTTENVVDETAAETTTEDVVNKTATVNETEAASASNEVTSSVTEDENGMTVWSQTNPETGTETTASFDMARGLVLKTTNEDGTVSDVAVGMNGITTTTVDAEGNEQVVSVGKDGISTTYEGADGTNETVDVDTATGTATVVRTDANGNTEEIVSDANGTTATKTETAADGSTRVTVTDENGEKTISEHNATTGYEATTNVAADGSAIKTESVNGVTTVTKTDTNGDITSQAVTREDADGNEVTKSYSVNDDGTVESSVSKNGVTMKTVTDADGNRTEVQSLVRDDGTVVTTTTEYGNDSVADSTHTVVTSAIGMETLQTADTTTGKDNIGEYTANKITTAEGTTETKDYGNGHTITVETAANGNQSVIEKTSDGFNIKETDSATGNVTTTTVSSDGTGKTVVTASDGSVISQNEIKADDNGATSYTTATGSSILMGTVGEGKEKEQVVSQSYMTGGTMTTSTNAKTGDSVITATDGLGSQTVTNYDGKTGSTTTQFTHINGNSGQSVLESDGSYRQDVVTVGGGSQTIMRSGEGANAVETTVKTDIAGDTYSTVSKGGHMERVEVMSGGSASFTQEAGENGSIITRQVLESGAVVTKTQQSNGDYMQETVNPNGSKTYVESTDGKVTRKDISLTGIETTAMRTGSTTTESVQYAGVNMTHVVDNATGEKQQVFTTTSGQTFTIGSDSNGGTKTVFETGDGNYGSYKQNADGSSVNIVRNANGSGRVETIDSNGAPEIIYTDASGNAIPAPQGADTFNNAYANVLAGFASQNVSIPRHTAGVNVIYTNPVTETEQTGNLNLPEASDTANNNAAYNMPMNFDENGNVRTVKVHNKRTTMLERLYGGMISGDEPDSNDTSDAPTSKTTKRKPLNNTISESMKLRRNSHSSGNFGDYDTRKSGSTTNAGNNANNAK